MNVQISGQGAAWQAPEIERLMNEAEVHLAEIARLRDEISHLKRDRERNITDFVAAILHGKRDHRGWLAEAGRAWNRGDPVPAPRG